MKKILVASLMLLGVVAMVKAEQTRDAKQSTVVQGSSGTVFTGGGVLYRLDLSTGDGLMYVIAIDSVVGTRVTLNDFPATQRKTIPMVFVSTANANGTGRNYVEFPGGIWFKDALFIHMTSDQPKTGVLWKK